VEGYYARGQCQEAGERDGGRRGGNVCRLPRGDDKRQRRYRGGAVIPLRREFVTRVARWFMVISSLLERHFRCLNRPRFALARSYISYPIPKSIGGSVTPSRPSTLPRNVARDEAASPPRNLHLAELRNARQPFTVLARFSGASELFLELEIRNTTVLLSKRAAATKCAFRR